jgi:hypothetical protein
MNINAVVTSTINTTTVTPMTISCVSSVIFYLPFFFLQNNMYNASWSNGSPNATQQAQMARTFWEKLELDRWFYDFEYYVNVLLKNTLGNSRASPNDKFTVERDVAHELSRLFRDIKAKYIK